MFYTEKNNITGLLIQIDFEKALNSVSWIFLYNVLESFGFDNNFNTWIRPFNTDIKACVPIHVEHGCRKGDPIVLYLILLVTEVLCCLFGIDPQIF